MKEEEWHEFDQYKNLIRCIDDQYVVDENGNLVPREGRDIKGTGPFSLRVNRTPSSKVEESTRISGWRIGKLHGSATTTKVHPRSPKLIFSQNTLQGSDYFKEYVESQKQRIPKNRPAIMTHGRRLCFCGKSGESGAPRKGILLIPPPH